MNLHETWNKLVGETKDEENIKVNISKIAKDLNEITNKSAPAPPTGAVNPANAGNS